MTKIPTISSAIAASIQTVSTKASRSLLKTPMDTLEISAQKHIVKVFNSLITDLKQGGRIISPEFNGCHGVGIVSDGKVFFAHFPPFMDGKMKDTIKNALSSFEADKKIRAVFVSPVNATMQDERVFEDYLKIIQEKFGTGIETEFLRYPRHSKGHTYTYTGIMSAEGTLINSLTQVSR